MLQKHIFLISKPHYTVPESIQVPTYLLLTNQFVSNYVSVLKQMSTLELYKTELVLLTAFGSKKVQIFPRSACDHRQGFRTHKISTIKTAICHTKPRKWTIKIKIKLQHGLFCLTRVYNRLLYLGRAKKTSGRSGIIPSTSALETFYCYSFQYSACFIGCKAVCN